MATGHFGSQSYVDKALTKLSDIKDIPPITMDSNTFDDLVNNDVLMLRNRVADLEDELSKVKLNVIETIKEVPVEVMVPVERIVEKIIEKEVQVIKEFPVFKEKIIKEFVDVVREVERIKEVEVVKEIKFVPIWIYGIFLVETLTIIVLLFKK